MVVLTPYGQRLLDNGLKRLPEEDEALTKLVDAISAPMEEGALIRGLGTDAIPYSPAMSVANAPSWVLPWLAQFVGVVIPVGTPDATARAMILARSNQRRGRPQTIIDVIKTFLFGTKSVTLQEQVNGDPFQFRAFINAYEAPYSEQTLTNLVTNPSAEVNTTGWTATGSTTLARVTTEAKYGTAAFSITNNTAGATDIWMHNDIDGQRWPIVGGGVYTWSCWVKTTVTRTVTMNISTAQPGGGGLGSGTSYGTQLSVSCPAGVWTKLSVAMRGPVSATFAKVLLTVVGAAAGEVHYVDGISVLNRPTGSYYDWNTSLQVAYTPPSTPPGYFDGSMPGGSWTGTAHASTSTLAPSTFLIKNAVAAIKPAGFTFDLVPTTGLAWDAATGQWDAAQGLWDSPGSPPA